MGTIEKRDIRSNTFIAIVTGAIRSIATMCAYGTIMQAFLASLGYTSDLLYINTTLINAVSLIAIPLSSNWADKGNIIRRAAIIQLPTAILFLLYLPACLNHDNSLTMFFYLTACCICQAIVTALFTVCDYKLPYFIFPAEGYGTMMAISGVVSSLISLGSGLLISFATQYMSYHTIMLIASSVSAALILLSAFLTSRLKALMHAEQMQQSKIGKTKHGSLLELFKTPIFLRLAPANFLRGVSYGSIASMAAVALDLGYDVTITTLLVSVTSAANMLGCAFFGGAARKLSPRAVILVGSLGSLLLPMMLLRGSPALFLTLYGVMLLFRNLVDYGVPYLLRQAVPVGISGPYNAWRQILNSLGTIVATSIATFIPVEWMLILGTVTQLFACFSYYFDKEIRRSMAPDRIQL